MPRRSRRSRGESSSSRPTCSTTARSRARSRETRPVEVYNLAAPSFVPRSWDEPIRTAEFAAVGATAMLEAIREVDPEIRFYQASSSEIFGEPRETPQTEETAPSPLTPYGVAKAYAHFIAGSYRKRYGMFTCCGILYNHESPLRPVDFLPAQGRARRRRDLARPRDGARARRPLGAAGLGLRRRLRPRDVAHAPARRARRLHRRDGRLALRRGAGDLRVRRRVARLARPRALRSGALPRQRRAPRPRRRRVEGAARRSAGSPRCRSSSSSRSWSRPTSSGSGLRLPPARRRGRGRVPSRPR